MGRKLLDKLSTMVLVGTVIVFIIVVTIFVLFLNIFMCFLLPLKRLGIIDSCEEVIDRTFPFIWIAITGLLIVSVYVVRA